MIEERVYEVNVDFKGDCTPAREQELSVLIDDAVRLLKDTFGVVAIRKVGGLQADGDGIYAHINYLYNSNKLATPVDKPVPQKGVPTPSVDHWLTQIKISRRMNRGD